MRPLTVVSAFFSRHSSAAMHSGTWMCRYFETVPAASQMLHNIVMHRAVAGVAEKILLSTVVCAWSLSAHAGLGGDSASIVADAQLLHGQVQPLEPASASKVSIVTDNGIAVHEFLDSGGAVFAVSWTGPAVARSGGVAGNVLRSVRQCTSVTAECGPAARHSYRDGRPGGGCGRAPARVLRTGLSASGRPGRRGTGKPALTARR